MASAPKRAARLTEVAKLAGVSAGLVSRIINEDETLRVRPETVESVRAAIEMLNYTPHSSARALRLKQTGLLGFALHHVNDPVYVEMVDAAQTAAAEQNYSIMLVNTAELISRGEAFREVVMSRRVDGLLIQSGFGGIDTELRDLAGIVPSIVFNANLTPGLRTLRFDDEQAAQIATEHLIELGHTSIGFIGAPGSTSDRRYEGFRRALESAGLQVRAPIDGGWDSDDSHDATVSFFESGGLATAFVVVTTTSALGVHSGITSLGMRMPDDLSLISIHDTWFARHLNPPLNAVSLPLAELGRQAVSALIDHIDSPTSGETIITEPAPQLVVRRSTGAPRA